MPSVRLKTRPRDVNFSQSHFSFSNTPAEGVHLLPGSTHVAVGFADLGKLAAAVSKWGSQHHTTAPAPPADSNSDSSSSSSMPAVHLAAYPLEFDDGIQDVAAMQAVMTQQTQHTVEGDIAMGQDTLNAGRALQLLQAVHQLNRGAASTTADEPTRRPLQTAQTPMQQAAAGAPDRPLVWVGYEISAYAVAKAVLLVEMMMQGADNDAVLQVWLDAAASLGAALQACLHVLHHNITW